MISISLDLLDQAHKEVTMVYKPAIPLSGDSPATDSQADILENFTQIGLQYGTDAISDHVAFSAGSANGLHKRVRLNDVQADPGLAFPQTQIYEKHLGGAGDRFPNLYWESKPENAAIAASVFPLNAIKAWCRFDGTGASPIAPADGFNVTNITHAGGTAYTINFTNNLQNANYAVIALTSRQETIEIIATAVASTQLTVSGAVQPARFSVVIIGN